jgi:1-acyl-sn-glycerol-3-phosphate acyltransferase
VVALTLPVVWLLGALTLLVTAPFDARRAAARRVVNLGCHQYLRCWPWWSVRVTGGERLPAGPCVIICNHQSMADIGAVMGLPLAFTFVSKASMFEVPFIGWMMGWLRHVPLDRGRRESMKQMLQTCSARLEQGEAVLVFPEGTYASGPARLPFRRGAFHLAQRHQVPVVPVVLRGTAELVFEDGPLCAARGEVTVEVMEPVMPPAPGEPLAPFIAGLEARYGAWLGQPFGAQGPVA